MLFLVLCHAFSRLHRLHVSSLYHGSPGLLGLGSLDMVPSGIALGLISDTNSIHFLCCSGERPLCPLQLVAMKQGLQYLFS